MRCMGLQNLKNKKPIQKWNKSHSKLTRGNRKGVDWYCYIIYILKLKLIPFVQACMKDCLDILI